MNKQKPSTLPGSFYIISTTTKAGRVAHTRKQMASVDLFAMKQIGKAIKALDDFRVSENFVKTEENVKRVDEARKNLINVLFSCGYELQFKTYRVVKSKEKRDLI